MNSKIFLIGLDGATWDLIKPWAEDGKLPTFKKLMDEGAWGILESTIPPLSPAAWTSIFTGVNPGKHSIYSFVKRKKHSYFIRPISSKDISVKLLWELLSDVGIKGIYLNIPFMYPPFPVNGILTTGLGTPSRDSDFSFPRKVKFEILNLFPNFDVDFNEDEILRSSNHDFILNRIKSITEAQIDVFKYFFNAKKNAKVFAIVLRSLDVVQHFFWDDKITILSYYQQVDNFLNWCVRNKDEKDILIICSDHGFREIKNRVYINEWLRKEGLLSTKKIPAFRSKFSSVVEKIVMVLIKLRLRSFVWKLKHSKHLEVLNKLFPSKTFSYIDEIDWNKTYAFFAFGDTIDVNLSDREPEGCVHLTKYNEVREEIIKRALKLENPKTGEKIFEIVKKGEEIYKKSNRVPDIVLYSKKGYRLSGLPGLSGGFSTSGKIFEKETERRGDHDVNGIICLYGYMINKIKLKNMHVCDVVPMILHMLGFPIPSYFDGKVPKKAFKAI